jgi:hypothetical protein
VLVAAALAAAPARQTFTGTISDEMCARDGHAAMRMGPTDAECTKMCILFHDSSYVLDAGKGVVYLLSDQKTPEKFAGQKVTITGTLDAKTKRIDVSAIVATK